MTNAEKEVAKLLKELGIFWNYEKPVYVQDDHNRPRVWTPDFFLVHFGVYVEVCGSKDFDYDYRRRIFDNNGYKVIFLHLYKDSSRWREHLFDYMGRILSYRYHKFKEISES
jgi:hypothetical protein